MFIFAVLDSFLKYVNSSNYRQREREIVLHFKSLLSMNEMNSIHEMIDILKNGVVITSLILILIRIKPLK